MRDWFSDVCTVLSPFGSLLARTNLTYIQHRLESFDNSLRYKIKSLRMAIFHCIGHIFSNAFKIHGVIRKMEVNSN